MERAGDRLRLYIPRGRIYTVNGKAHVRAAYERTKCVCQPWQNRGEIQTLLNQPCFSLANGCSTARSSV